ncbi:MAG: hypothetical protein H7Y86_01105 [Rhizobacter sp.]|nr:hypothetical protein [Ferruginibacter sp.]
MYAIKGDHIHITDAQGLEQKGDWPAAAALYEKLLKQSPKNIRIIERLLVLFRKTGDAKNEAKYIDLAIKIHEQRYVAVIKPDKKVTALSNQLNKMLGHTDKKGKPAFVADEIGKLQLRKARLLTKKITPLKKKK